MSENISEMAKSANGISKMAMAGENKRRQREIGVALEKKSLSVKI